MKNILILATALSMLLNISCKKQKSTILEAMVEVLIINQQSQNLLVSPAILNESNIDLYYFNNGQSTLFHRGNLGAP